jgi:hypothetical protein
MLPWNVAYILSERVTLHSTPTAIQASQKIKNKCVSLLSLLSFCDSLSDKKDKKDIGI